MINKVSTVIFDLDGTLVNSWKIHLESCKYAYSRVMNKTCSTLLIKRYAMPTEEATLGCLVGEENKERALKFYNKYFLDNLCELFLIPPIDIHNMLEYLKDRKMKLGIFTGRSRETTYALLKYTDLIKYFDVIITSSDNIPSKPNPDGLALAIEMLEAKKEESIFIGDTESDLDIGKKVDVYTIKVDWFTENFSMNKSYEVVTASTPMDLKNRITSKI